MSTSRQLSSRIKTDSKCMKCKLSTKNITCNHTYCLQCFDQYQGGESGSNETECLLCMMRSIQSDGKLLDPQTFFFLGKSSGDKQSDEPKQKCEVCLRLGVEERYAAVQICQHCQMKMCQGCLECHKALKLDQIALPSKKCDAHPDKDMTVYCSRCESGHCGKDDCVGPFCATKAIRDAASELKEQLKTKIRDLEALQSQVAEQENILNLQAKELEEIFKLQEKRIHETREQVVDLVNKHILFATTRLESQKQLSSENIESLRKKLRAERLPLDMFGLCVQDIVDNPFVLASSVKHLTETAESLKLEAHRKVEEHVDSYFLPSDDSDYYMETDEVARQIFQLFATCAITFKEYNKKPKLRINLPFELAVYGVALFDRRMFVIFKSSSEIRIYDSDERYTTMSIVSDTSKKVNPSDIVASNDSVYVCDSKKKLVHRVKLPEEVKSNWMVTNVSSISTLSVTKSNNILVACKKLFSDEVKEYTADGSFIQRIEFESASITHVVEHNKLYLVCENTILGHDLSLYTNESGGCLNESGECLIRASCVTKVSPGSLDLDNPSYVVKDRNGFIFVADRNENRIMVYNPKLEYVNQWNVAGQPHRLCLDEKQKKLYVLFNTKFIEIYDMNC